MYKSNSGFTLMELVIVLVILFGSIGWVLNLVQVVQMLNDPITSELIFRGIAVFIAPVGAVIGWIPF